MKKIVLTTMFLLLFTMSFVGSAGARGDVGNNPKQHQACIDESGKWNDKCGDLCCLVCFTK